MHLGSPGHRPFQHNNGDSIPPYSFSRRVGGFMKPLKRIVLRKDGGPPHEEAAEVEGAAVDGTVRTSDQPLLSIF